MGELNDFSGEKFLVTDRQKSHNVKIIVNGRSQRWNTEFFELLWNFAVLMLVAADDGENEKLSTSD